MRRSRQILVAVAAAVVAAAAIATPLLLRGGGSSPRPSAAPKTATATKTPAAARPQAKRQAKPARPAAKRAKTRPARPVPLPLASARPLPWHGDGFSRVARAVNRRLAVYGRPGAKRPTVLLQNPDRLGVPRVLLVSTQRKQWVRLYMPNRPDGHAGWVRRHAVRVLRNPYRIVVHLRSHRLLLWRGHKRVFRTRIVVGAPATPTPRGLFYVTQLLKPPDPNGAYGPFSFGLSAHSRVLKEFSGGNGQVGIHGTNEPWLLGRSASHGCIRVSNAAIRRMARVLPLGTPVLVRG